jgi:asparagine synthase (glutamine-hydrolysing)
LEFKASNHTYGKKTLLKDVYQIQASECIVIENNKIIKSFFNYSYAIEKENVLEFKYLKEKAIIAFENSFKRCLDSLHNRIVAIPLSGGFDSRLITVFLKKYNYRNVICFTYGNKNSFEIENSKKVANQLGFKWYFIEYSQETIGDFLNDNQFKEYINFASKLSSMPSLQEYFAVKYLQKNNLIPNNAIFISGFAGDLLGGSQFLKIIPKNLTFNAISSLIIDKKLINYPIKTRVKNKLKQKINQQLFEFDKDCNKKIPSSVFEDFDIKEKISKFIFNSASFYSFFGYEFRFPFWDKELLDFFKEVPVELKYNKLLFDDVLINKYFKPFNVFFENEIRVKNKKKWITRIRKKVKPFIPSFMKEKRLEKLSWMNYKNITQEMLFFLKKKNINVKRAYNGYNEIIAQWYIYISKNGFD